MPENRLQKLLLTYAICTLVLLVKQKAVVFWGLNAEVPTRRRRHYYAICCLVAPRLTHQPCTPGPPARGRGLPVPVRAAGH